MLKYLRTDIVFQEVPGETSLAVAISGCTLKCEGCHSRYLWEDKGETLDVEALCGMLNNNQGITCCLLMGGEHDMDTLTELFMYARKRVKTAWYSGLDIIPKDRFGILDVLDYCKLGHFDMELGGLDCPTTNQRLYQYSRYYSDFTIGKGWRDITYRLQKK